MSPLSSSLLEMDVVVKNGTASIYENISLPQTLEVYQQGNWMVSGVSLSPLSPHLLALLYPIILVLVCAI